MIEKKVYIWHSSIPESWKRIAGEDNFIHISKSNRAKNTLEFLEETQRYILKIRGAVHENSCKKFKWPIQDKNRTGKKKPSLLDELSPVRPLEPVHSPILQNIGESFLPSISEKTLKKTEPSVKRNYSTNSLPVKSYLKYVNTHEEYSKRSHEKQPDFLSLPKALKANFNRVFNSVKS